MNGSYWQDQRDIPDSKFGKQMGLRMAEDSEVCDCNRCGRDISREEYDDNDEKCEYCQRLYLEELECEQD